MKQSVNGTRPAVRWTNNGTDSQTVRQTDHQNRLTVMIVEQTVSQTASETDQPPKSELHCAGHGPAIVIIGVLLNSSPIVYQYSMALCIFLSSEEILRDYWRNFERFPAKFKNCYQNISQDSPIICYMNTIFCEIRLN